MKCLEFKEEWPLLLLIIVNVILFSLNFRSGYQFVFWDMPFLELDPARNLWGHLFMWQMTIGFGLELGQELGYAVPLFTISILELAGMSPLNVNHLYNMVLFVFPSISMYVLARVFFRQVRSVRYIAFFAGFFGNYNFYSYITGSQLVFVRRWPLVTVPLILAFMMMFLRSGKGKDLALVGVFSFLTLGAFPHHPVFLVAPVMFVVLYMAYHMLFESERRIQSLRRIGTMVCVVLLTSLPLLFAYVHYFLSTNPLDSRYQKSYTASQIGEILTGSANSSLLNSFRLVGSVGWDVVASWKGEYAYPYYPLFASSPIFVLSSFMLPLLAFGSLLFHDTKKMTTKLVFLSSVSVVFLFLVKGGSEPFGSLFAWAVLNMTYFGFVFRTPFDKAGMVLTITMPLAAAYTTVRILTIRWRPNSGSHIQSKHYSNVLNLGVQAKPLLAVLLICVIAINTYPAIAGQVMEQKAFFKIPSYYSDIATYVASDPAIYKILGLPEMNNVHLYKWGYFGDQIDGWLLSKPILHYCYMGYDLYDEAMIRTILGEVAFRSGSRGYRIMDWSNVEPIFQNDNGSRSTINLERVKYFGYLLQMANVGAILYRQDVVGYGGYWLNDIDRARYNELLDTLQRVGVVSPPLKFGALMLYRVLRYNPIIYDTPLSAAYNVNNYEVMLDSYDTNSRLAILSSFFSYDPNMAFTYNSLNVMGRQVYVPLLMRQYYNRVIGDLNVDSAVGIEAGAETTNEAKVVKFMVTQLGRGYSYYDQIATDDTFDVYANLKTAQNSTLQKMIDELNIAIELAHSVSGSNLSSNVTESIRSIMNHVTNFLGANTPSALVPVFFLRDVRDLNSALDKGKKQAVIDLITEIVDGFRLGDYTAGSSSLIGQNLYYDNNGQQVAMKILDVKEQPDGSGWYHIGRTTLERGAISIGTSFWYARPILLLPVKEHDNEAAAPSVSFFQVNPTEYVITISGASQNFILNFLQSYGDGWKLFLRNSPLPMLGNPVYSSNGGAQIVGSQFLFTEEQLTAPTSSPVFDAHHMLLNGFANSWYIDLHSLIQRGLIDRAADGSYNFQLSLIYLPQSYLYYSAAASIVGLTIIGMIMICARSRKYRSPGKR